MGESNLQDRLAQGVSLDQYVLLERIGSGGQAAVWSAWDEQNHRVVAIKVILSAETETAPLQQTALREAQLVASLKHPNILPLYDFKFSDQLHYLVMRYICGGTLRDIMGSGPLPPLVVLDLAEQLTSALAHLHERGVVHRDLKPSNILFDTQGRAYLTDFGLARDLSENAFQLHTGRGTPPYAPPEQHTYAPITPQSDIYSLGVMLYEMFTGSLPFGGDLSLATRQIHGNEELPDPRAANPQLPATLMGALRIITSADPAERPKTAADAMWLLRQVFTGWQTRENDQPDHNANPIGLDDPALAAQDATSLVQKALLNWRDSRESYEVGLTQFRLIDSVYSRADSYGLHADDAVRQFMLYTALAYGQNLEHWSSQTSDPEERLQICEEAIIRGPAEATRRAILLLLENAAHGIVLTDSAVARLVTLALDTSNETLSSLAFALIHRSQSFNAVWKPAPQSKEADELATAALGRGLAAQRAAQIIGYQHSTSAVAALLHERGRYQPKLILNALLRIREAAGGIPNIVPPDLRAQILMEASRRHLFENPMQLIRAYLSTLLGGLLGFGTYVYLTYQLPQFLDATRILVALEHGFFLGATVGLGLFSVRLIIERLNNLSRGARVAISLLVGTLIVNLSLVLYHTLFLGSPPTGWIIAAGSIVLVGLTALSALIRPFFGRMLMTASGVFLAIWGGWQIHSRNHLDPILWFDPNWSDQRILLTILATTITLALLAHAVSLRRKSAPNDLNVVSV
jgi:serine/threonine protein kinase